METVRKHATIAFLLLLTAAIFPAYTNEEIVNEKQEITVETIIEWYKRPEVRQKIRMGIEVACTVTAFAAIVAGMWYMDVFKVLNRPVNKQEEEKKDHQSHNMISDVIVSGTITQTDGKNTTIITPGKKPIWIKQDSTGTWIKHDASSPWVLWNSPVIS